MKKDKDTLIDVFENLSIVLTGFSRADIIGTGLLQTYYDTVVKELGRDVFKDILISFQKIKIDDFENLSTEESSEVSDFTASKNNTHFIGQIIQLWYLGEWIISPYSDQNYIISSQSYLEGLVWRAIAAHPMGGKQPGYGTWSFPPLTFTSN